MLVRDNIVFILRVYRLIMRRNIDLIVRQFVLAEILEEVCIPRSGKVDICVV